MDNVGCDMICKNHSARSDKEQYRICSTKLSKSELENLYFTLMENNLELKKTVNLQEDRIKVLSTKMQRMSTAQKIYKPDARKDCCVATKAVVNQQKEIITDLKLSNEHMADRIRKLNMRLCSAKQFCKSVTPRCLRCSTETSPYLIKNSSCSQQQSQSTLKLAVSCQNLSRNHKNGYRSALSSKHTQTEVLDSTKQQQKPCDDNKCSSLIEDLKQKIIGLKEELSKTNEEYSVRTKVLQLEIEESRNESIRERSERVATEYEVQKKDQKISVLTTNLRAAEGLANELKTELSIERRKVFELETRIKAATMSDRVAKCIEDTLNSIQQSNMPDLEIITNNSPSATINSQHSYTETYLKDVNADETTLPKSADDSGYIDTKSNTNMSTSMDEQSLNKMIEELTKRIIVLQTQVDALTISQPTFEKVVDHCISADDEKEIITCLESSLPLPKVIENPSSNYTNESIDTINEKPNKELSKTTVISCDDKDLIRSSNTNSSNRLQIPSTIKNEKWQKNVTKLVILTNKSKGSDKFKDSIDHISENNETNIQSSHNNQADNTLIEEKTIRQSDGQSHSAIVDRRIHKKHKSTESDDGTYNVLKEGDKLCERHDDINKEVPETKTERRNLNPGNRKMLIKSKTLMPKPMVKERLKNNLKQKTIVKPTPIVRTDIEPCDEEATYTIECDSSSRAESADNTDYEISSMTDLSEEMDRKRPSQGLLSPGEQRATSTHTESFTTTTTNFSLSEGEIPTNTVRRRSYGENSRTDHGSTPKVEDTLQAISEQIALCKKLMSTRQPQYSINSINM